MKLIDNNLRSFQIKGRLPQWAYWVIAAALFGIAWLGVAIWARQAALKDLAGRQDSWTADGILEQTTNYTCVPSAIVMLLKDQGISTTTYEVAVLAGTDIRGTDGHGIIKAGEHFGFLVERKLMTSEEFLRASRPGIVAFRRTGTRHAAYVKPADPGLIEMKDSVDGLMLFDAQTANEWFGRRRWEVYLFERGD